MGQTHMALALLRGAAGGAVGGALGYFGFFWLTSHALYSIMLPGAALGLGCGLASGRRSFFIATLSMIAALALGIWTEWRWAPFTEDRSLEYFVLHLDQLSRSTKIMVLVGGMAAFYLGIGNDRRRRTADDGESEDDDPAGGDTP